MTDEPRWGVGLAAIFATIVVSFLAATAYGQWRLRQVDDAVAQIAHDTSPSIERLAAARSEIRQLVGLLEQSAATAELSVGDARAVRQAEDAVDRSLSEYLVLPLGPGERDIWQSVLQGKDALERSVARVEFELDRGGTVQAQRLLSDEVASSVTDLNGALTDAIEFNAARSATLASDVQRYRHNALVVAIALDALCTVIAIVGAILLRRMVRAHAALTARHGRLEAERASELEQFAGRVAHDILSPLGAVGVALRLATRAESPADRSRAADRGIAALERVKRLVSDLLSFARAGAVPDPDALADVDEVMRDLNSELEPTAAEAGVTLTMTSSPHLLVACSPGVLTSLLANLTRNAIKYIGNGDVRRIEVRARESGSLVRFEVEDTGPGLSDDVEGHVFDPYVRSRHANQPGIGLGLATVKRLAEAHGGTVGVESIRGSGCTFWFELPAPSAARDARNVSMSLATRRT